MSEDLSVEEKFKLATTYISKSFAKKQYPDLEELGWQDQLKFYGFFKQASHGPASENSSKKPSFWELTAKKKWGAWEELKDMSKEDAMKGYVAQVTKHFEKWMEYEGLKEFFPKKEEK